MIIDFHTHIAFHEIFPAAFLGEVADSLGAKSVKEKETIAYFLKAGLSDANASGFMKKMDEASIDVSVLLIADFGIALGEPALSLEAMHLLHKKVADINPERFIVFSGMDPRRGAAGLDLFEKSINEYGFKGLKLYPPCGFELDDKGLMPFYEICDSLGLPVLTHTGPSLKALSVEQHYPSTILKVSKEFKNIPFILGHGGARDCDTTIEIVSQRENVFFDISTFQRFIPSDDALNAQFRIFFDRCPDRILFGTDFPMFLLSSSQKQLVDKIKGLTSISAEEKNALFYQNAQQLLKLEKVS